MRTVRPLVATVITNPTARDLKYQFIGTNGMTVRAGQTVILPYDVYTAARPTQRGQLGQYMESKLVKISIQSRVPVEKVPDLSSTVERPGNPTEPVVAKDLAEVEETPVEVKEPREKIVVATGEGKDAVEDSKDLVQKFTGQETVSMRDAMGWEAPPTDDPRTPQEAEVVTMDQALTENVGDPEEKAAAAAAKEAAAKGIDPKKSAAAKKAAETRRKNAEKKAKK